MITFPENFNPKDKGIISKRTLEQIKTIYPDNPDFARELAITAIAYATTGEIISDNPKIKDYLI